MSNLNTIEIQEVGSGGFVLKYADDEPNAKTIFCKNMREVLLYLASRSDELGRGMDEEVFRQTFQILLAAPQHQTEIDCFACSHQYGSTRWGIEDVREIARNDYNAEISIADAEDILSGISGKISDAQTDAGNLVIGYALNEFFHPEIYADRKTEIKNISAESV